VDLLFFAVLVVFRSAAFFAVRCTDGYGVELSKIETILSDRDIVQG